MKINGQTNLVIAGNWNLAILTPEWILNEFPDKFNKIEEIPIEYSARLNSIRFTLDNILIQPELNRLNLFAKVEDEAHYMKISDIAISIYEKLPHTPISAVGHNTSFIIEDEKFPFYKTEDIDNFEQKYKEKIKNAVLNSQQLKHSIEFEDYLLNLTYNITRQNKYIDFNYHYPVKDKNKTVDYINRFKENIINSKKFFSDLKE